MTEKKVMKQMPIDPAAQVPYEWTDGPLPAAVRTLQPILYRDGDAYCAVLGPDPQAGVFGCGHTPEQALKNWDRHVQELAAGNYSVDEAVRQFVLDALGKEGEKSR